MFSINTGRCGTYDLVIGVDSIHSTIRDMEFGDVALTYQEMTNWAFWVDEVLVERGAIKNFWLPTSPLIFRGWVLVFELFQKKLVSDTSLAIGHRHTYDSTIEFSSMYSLVQLKKGLKRPRDGVMEVNAQLNWQRAGEKYHTDGENFMRQDWDILTILDACRYDVFDECAGFPGNLRMAISRGGGTQEFLRGNFKDTEFHDTVYVTANPQIERHKDWLNVSFHDVRHIWKSGWDDDLRTVRPETMAQAALNAATDYPNKRLLVHFNQPHSPYIGEKGQKNESFVGRMRDDDHSIENGFVSDLLRDLRHPGTPEEHREIYSENLKLALPHVQQVMDEIEGLHVVTADHGEMLGERGRPIPITYHGHRMGCHVDELVNVPWLEYRNGTRREIRSDPPATSPDVNRVVVNDRLRDLGYIE